MTNKIFEAIAFANKIHDGQYRKSTPIPKLVHLVGVMNILLELGASEELAIAGLLHDAIEDTPTTLNEINNLFSSEVCKYIAGASEPDKKDSWENRKKHTIASIKDLPIETVALICADKLDNFRFTHREFIKNKDQVWTRFNRGKESQSWYFKEITKALKIRLINTKWESMIIELEQINQELFD